MDGATLLSKDYLGSVLAQQSSHLTPSGLLIEEEEMTHIE